MCIQDGVKVTYCLIREGEKFDEKLKEKYAIECLRAAVNAEREIGTSISNKEEYDKIVAEKASKEVSEWMKKNADKYGCRYIVENEEQ